MVNLVCSLARPAASVLRALSQSAARACVIQVRWTEQAQRHKSVLRLWQPHHRLKDELDLMSSPQTGGDVVTSFNNPLTTSKACRRARGLE